VSDDHGDRDRDYRQVIVSVADAVDMFVPNFKAAVKALESKHGPLTRDTVRAAAIMSREMGEVTDAALILTYRPSGVAIPETVHEAQVQHLCEEISQVIAVGIYMLCNLLGERVDTEIEKPILVPEQSQSKKVN
jgi:NTP pyrophosphatase (non-canonical NTP hydrolase)